MNIASCRASVGERIRETARATGRWLGILVAAEGLAADGVRFSVQEERLGDLSELAQAIPSPDGCHVAEWRNAAGPRAVVIVDGKPDAEYDRVILGTPTIFFSPDSGRWGYRAMRGSRQTMVVDGRAGPDYDEVGPLLFSPDSRHAAYAARTGDRREVILDGKPGPEHDNNITGLTFSPDSAHVAYVAVDYKTAADGRPLGMGDRLMPGNSVARMILDGQAGPEFEDFCGDPVFSPDSARLAYSGKLPRSGQQALVVDGKTVSTHPSILKIVFSPDSRRLVCWVRRDDGKAYVVCDGQAGPDFDDIPGDLVFSPDSRHVAYLAGRAGRWVAVLDGQAGPDYDGMERAAWLAGGMRGLLFSPDSNWLAYVAIRGGKQRVVVAGREGPECDRVEALLFSPDSRRVAYLAAQNAKKRVIVDGLPGPEFADIDPLSLRFSPDSKRLAYAAKNGRHPVVVIDGQVSPDYEENYQSIRIAFSRDSRHTAYVACRGGRTCVVCDGQPGGGYDGALEGGPWFHPGTQQAMVFVRQERTCALALDGQLGPACDRILKYDQPDRVNPAHPTVRPDGTVEYLAVKDGALVRIRHVPVKP